MSQGKPKPRAQAQLRKEARMCLSGKFCVNSLSARKYAQMQTPGKTYPTCNGPLDRGAVMRRCGRERGKLVSVSKARSEVSLTFNGCAISRIGYEFFNGRRMSASAITRPAR